VRLRSADRFQPELALVEGKSRTKIRIVVLLTVIASVMITSVVLYIDGAGSRRVSGEGPAASGGTTVTLSVESIQSNYSVLMGNLVISPGPALLDPATDGLKQDLTVQVTSVATPVKRTWSKGMLPGVFPIPLTLSRDIERWPFDRYYTGPITVEPFVGAAQTPERANMVIVDRLPGWKITASGPNKARPSPVYNVEMQRSASTMVFAIVILCILVAIACGALLVAVQTMRSRRKFQSPMMTWYAAMLFAVVPLRNALPGSPAFGSWIDMTIVLWVLVTLVVSMLLYIACWWRHLPPDPGVDVPVQRRSTVTALPRR
ncbi:DUF4436 domain-containing protein, partial [Mycobacterium numidiamassiliense]